ncbi:hypothetical protein [Pediococcus acidilactici]|uniref:hypothetical protein n=1 Tax=Pediococcus acidilactici TaxID=1254 RepID=UPI002B003608|nr:hypothetical protein [Pediococcus acidilactici]WQS12294.1 hypothetical protein SGW13_11025 [Pediococcus acidilactici]
MSADVAATSTSSSSAVKADSTGASSSAGKADSTGASSSAGKADSTGASSSAVKADSTGASSSAGKADSTGASSSAGKADSTGASSSAGKADSTGASSSAGKADSTGAGTTARTATNGDATKVTPAGVPVGAQEQPVNQYNVSTLASESLPDFSGKLPDINNAKFKALDLFTTTNPDEYNGQLNYVSGQTTTARTATNGDATKVTPAGVPVGAQEQPVNQYNVSTLASESLPDFSGKLPDINNAKFKALDPFTTTNPDEYNGQLNYVSGQTKTVAYI